MKLKAILPYAQQLMALYTNPRSIAVDATCGNGNDTLFLAEAARHVYAFDIQQQAIDNAKVKTAGYDNITFIHDGHQNVLDYVNQRIDCAIFNLGYLPRGDKSIVTLPETTIQAIERLFSILNPGGGIILVIYPGHEEGQIEKQAVLDYLQQFDQQQAHVLRYEFINQKNNPPFICVIEKR